MLNVIGVMSGTSLDGIDVCRVLFSENEFQILNYIEISYEESIKEKIIEAIDNKFSISEVTSLDYELGYEYSRAIKLALEKWELTATDIDLIANHGQTIYHNDNKEHVVNSTLQLGNGDIIKRELQTPVVTDFRAADIAVGNKGAPLVQLFDKYLINLKGLENASFLNIGGISNIYIDRLNKSFDTGPGNMMINYVVKQLYNLDYDSGGKIASRGKVCEEMLSSLMNHKYFTNNNQLSTGREDFGDQYTESILSDYKNLKSVDVVKTLTKFTADSIASEYLKLMPDEYSTIYVSGGGAYNKTLLELLQSNFKKIKIKDINEIGIDANQKEAVAFAYLGYANYKNIKLKTLNGNEVILGVLHKEG